MLDEVYRMQRLFNNKVIGFDILAIEKEEDRVKWFRNYLTAYDQELKELLESLDRDWIIRGEPGDRALDRNNIKVEIVDMLHFLISMFQVIGEKGIDPSSFAGRSIDFAGYFEGLRSAFEKEHGLKLQESSDRAVNASLLFLSCQNLVALGGLLDCLAWKWWAGQMIDWHKVRRILYESIFPQWCLLAMASGMSAPETEDLYFRKNRLNFERQEKGYKEGTYRKVDEQGREDNEKLFK